jgi:hypothetical protein
MGWDGKEVIVKELVESFNLSIISLSSHEFQLEFVGVVKSIVRFSSTLYLFDLSSLFLFSLRMFS